VIVTTFSWWGLSIFDRKVDIESPKRKQGDEPHEVTDRRPSRSAERLELVPTTPWETSASFGLGKKGRKRTPTMGWWRRGRFQRGDSKKGKTLLVDGIIPRCSERSMLKDEWRKKFVDERGAEKVICP